MTFKCPRGHLQDYELEGDRHARFYCSNCQQAYSVTEAIIITNTPRSDHRDPLLQEREKTHGSFAVNAEVWQALCDIAKTTPFANDSQRLAINMIFLKISRLLQQPKVKDHWDDIAGYAKLGSEACD